MESLEDATKPVNLMETKNLQSCGNVSSMAKLFDLTKHNLPTGTQTIMEGVSTSLKESTPKKSQKTAPVNKQNYSNI